MFVWRRMREVKLNLTVLTVENVSVLNMFRYGWVIYQIRNFFLLLCLCRHSLESWSLRLCPCKKAMLRRIYLCQDEINDHPSWQPPHHIFIILFYDTTVFLYTCILLFQSHDDFNEDHKKLSIAEYKQQSTRLETRKCLKHTGQAYVTGCKTCLSVFCVKCTTEKTLCDDGKGRQLQLHD